MRTYSRKPPNLKELENVEELCRLCLEKLKTGIPIYTSDTPYSSLALRIMVCAGIKMSKEDLLPNMICHQCHKELEKCYTFRKKCETSYQRLKTHILAVKQKEYQEEEKKREVDKTEDATSENVEVKQNLVFTVNMDGSIQLCDSSNGILDGGETLITLGRMEEDFKGEFFTNNYLGLEMKQTKEFQWNEPADTTKILEDSINSPSCSNQIFSDFRHISRRSWPEAIISLVHFFFIVPQNKVAYHVEKPRTYLRVFYKIQEPNTLGNIQMETEDLIFESNNPDCDLKSILSSMLIDLGILTFDGDGVVSLTTDASRNIEVTTGNGELFTMELVEEDNEKPSSELQFPIETFREITKASNSEMKKHARNVVLTPVNKKDAQNKSNKKGESEMVVGSVMRGVGKRVSCGICGKMLASRSVLKRHHRSVHARARPHVCQTCGKTFAQKEVWARHLLVHQESRPFACSLCPRSFTQRGALTAHARLHTPPHKRPLTLHQCPICPKVFLYSSGLSRHIGQHKGRQWVCGECGRGFSDTSSLRRHQRSTNHCALEPHPDPDTQSQKTPVATDTG